ncbi:SbcC/MukB-like Walker B domain-containing protein [Cohaesibacter gelatinilyticus]|uniref:Exonuclease SbcC n=1 Tax=Cohaesibacter gelatinilyticus TaxID=372072 RepID=A0A285PC54_9HYPH|nr:SMC family ATPase [Cohaesibacter gelatinilyticus]SNZ19018.1 exonuclease SbcC [Cohaesibacter gelatinilyticus]
MRPIRLTLQAFGPYAGCEVVDFRNVLDAGVFGIYGPTGAGKTSIFDGISFALFGVSSGDERAPEDMLSHYADPSVLTKVELVFDLGEKRYVVRRIPKQQRSASRGNNLAVQHHEAYLFDATGLTLEDFSDDFAGEIVAEKKVSVVDNHIKDLLGYDAAQFRQIVLLPQGEFRQILTAKSDDRAVILKRLFDVSSYERIMHQAREKAAVKRREIQDQRLIRDNKLIDTGCETLAEFLSQIEGQETALAALAAKLPEMEKDLESSQQALIEAQMLSQKFKDLASAREEQEKLAEAAEQISLYQDRLVRAKQAQSVVTSESLFKQAQDQVQQAIRREVQAKQALEQANARHIAASQHLKEQEANKPQRDAALETVREFERWATLIEKAQPLREKGRQTQRQLEKARLDQQRMEGSVQTQKTALADLRLLQKEQPAHAKALFESEKTLGALETELKAARDFETASRSVAAASKDVEQFKQRHTIAEQKLMATQQVFADAEKELTDSQILHVAHKLEDGQPCPVCGSAEHPNPAKGDPERLGRHDHFAEAEQARDEAAKLERAAATDLNRALAKLEERQAALDVMAKPERVESEIVKALNDAKSEQMRLTADRRFADLEARLGKAEAELSDAEQALERAKVSVGELEIAQSNAVTELKTVMQDVPADWHDAQRLAQELSRHRDHAQRLEGEWQKAIEVEKQTAVALASAQQAQAGLQGDIERLQEEKDKAEQELERVLIEADMDLESYQAAKPDIAHMQKLESKIQGYEQAKAANKDRQDRLIVEIGEALPPDLEALGIQKQASMTALNAAREEQARQGSELMQKQKRLKDLQDLNAKIADLEEIYKPLGEIADLVNGNNDVKIRLPDFAVAAMLDEVLMAANLRLGPMTGGRYQLHRPEERTGGRGKRGLDIVVFDGNTQISRPTKSLSGGEGFQASLALALGLSDVVEQNSGGIKLDAIFIDEGFGSLDEETLDTALDSLCSLSGEKRAVGLISHTEQVKALITAGFDIEKTPNGSHIRERAI